MYPPMLWPKERREAARTDVLQGTLDLMVLKTLESIGPQHGYGIARRIEQISDAVLKLNEGTVYASLMRLRQRRWISASWGTSENNRRARFYALTRTGRQQLAMETENWASGSPASSDASLVARSSPDMWSRSGAAWLASPFDTGSSPRRR